MKLSDLLPKSIKSRLNLAAQTKQEIALPESAQQEVGVGYEAYMNYLPDEVKNSDRLVVQDYINMQVNDGEVCALISLLSLPITSAGFKIVPHPDDKDGEVAKFVENNLMTAPFKGGMDIPLSTIIQDMTRGLAEGFRLYEKVFRLDENNHWVYKRISPRDARSMSIIVDQNGYFNGARQRVTFMGVWRWVTINRDKLVHLVFNRKHDWNYGRSLLKAAWYHYDKKHKLSFFANKQAELGAFKMRIANELVKLTPDQKKALKKSLDSFGMNSTAIMIPSSGQTDGQGHLQPAVDLKFEEPIARGLDIKGMIEYHDQQMSKSVLAQFIELGTHDTGSWALSQDQSDLFMMAEKSYMTTIEDCVNLQIIAPLIDINFGNELYPSFEFNDLTRETEQTIQAMFTEIIKRQDVPVPPKFLEEIFVEMADKLSMKWSPEVEIQAQKDEATNQPQGVEINKPEEITPNVNQQPQAANIGIATQPRPPLSKFSDKKNLVEKSRWRRELRDSEKKLNLEEMDKDWKNQRTLAASEIRKVFAKQAKGYIKTGKFDANGLKKTVYTIIKNAVDAGKNYAAQELKKKSPKTNSDTINRIRKQANDIGDKASKELERAGQLLIKKVGLADNPIVKLTVIRHGTTNLNGDHKIRSWHDVPLSQDGIDEAGRLGKDFKDKGFDGIITSDLKRAKQTANIVSDESGIPVIGIDKRLRPWNLGVLAGTDEVKAIPTIKKYAIDQPHKEIPKGESFNDFKDRFLGGIQDIVRKHKGKRIAIVTHHRGERLLDAFIKDGQPKDFNISPKALETVMLQKGEDPGTAKDQIVHLAKKPKAAITFDPDSVDNAVDWTNNDIDEEGDESIDETQARQRLYDKYTDRRIEPMAGIIVASGINLGKNNTYNAFANDIQSFEWSAILDEKTCDFCEGMDGTVVASDSSEYDDNQPPDNTHFDCRCQWIGIGNDESNPPEVTGIPDDLPNLE